MSLSPLLPYLTKISVHQLGFTRISLRIHTPKSCMDTPLCTAELRTCGITSSERPRSLMRPRIDELTPDGAAVADYLQSRYVTWANRLHVCPWLTAAYLSISRARLMSSRYRVDAVVKVDRRIRWHYTTTILRLRIVKCKKDFFLIPESMKLAGTLALSAGTLMAHQPVLRTG